MDIHERNGRIAPTKDRPTMLLRSKQGVLLLFERIDDLVPLCRNCHVLFGYRETSLEVKKRLASWQRPKRYMLVDA
jgi:hypothetical protein